MKMAAGVTLTATWPRVVREPLQQYRGPTKAPEHLALCQEGKPAWFHQSGFTALSRPQDSDCGLAIVALCGESGCGSPVGRSEPALGCLVPRGVVGEWAAI
jgi:hypothetical protein